MKTQEWRQHWANLLYKLEFLDIGNGVKTAYFPPLCTIKIVRKLSGRRDGHFNYTSIIEFTKSVVKGKSVATEIAAIREVKRYLSEMLNAPIIDGRSLKKKVVKEERITG